MAKKAVVIGSGFAGLSAACFLADGGFDVTVLEKNETLGGRARVFEADGFRFDMGPSWYWMPEVFDRFFGLFGRKTSDFYELKRLDPSYRVYFGEGDSVDLPASMAEIEALFEQLEPGSAASLRAFLKEAAYKYEVGMTDFVHRPSHSIWEFADVRILKSLFQLQMFSSIATDLKKRFKSPKIRQILEFPSLFLGATAEKTPALYSLMNHADLVGGTWYPMGGMHKIIEGMVELAKSLGVRFETSAEVTAFSTENGRVKSVLTEKKGAFEADVVVGAADYAHLDQKILAPEHRNYSPDYWASRAMAPSSLLYYIGLEKRAAGLLHHTLFFDRDFGRHAAEIYERPAWPSEPLFYAGSPSKTDSTVAPAGCENLFLLIPVAPGLEDSDEVRERYFEMLETRLEKLTGERLSGSIRFKKSYAHRDFVQDYHAFRGNAYGLANTLFQTAFLKPRLRSKKLSNLFFAGQLTVPGPGVPPSLISGEVAAREILKKFKPN